ncbi:MAG: DUF4384 domain-containing protein [Flammeovirgaceae bacterium]|nr:DUF4384 domain-containing protein [Flammeovirgaceae bacterium]
MKTYFIIIFLLSAISIVNAQKKAKTVKVAGKAEIRIEDAYCIGEIKQRVIDLAKIDALEKTFGKVIVQGTNTYIENINTGEKAATNTQMNVIANSMVRGEFVEENVTKLEWFLRDRENPTGMKQELWILCEIEGKAREMKEADVAFEAKTMNCINPGSCNTEVYHNNERVYLNFQTPVNGYLSVYMQDNEDGIIYRLFPYSKMSGDYESAVPVQADLNYILFSEQHHKTLFPDVSRSILDPISAYTTKEQLFNRIFVVFSPDPYNKPLLDVNHAAGGIKTMDTEKFHQWLNKNKARNTNFQTSNIDIIIKK